MFERFHDDFGVTHESMLEITALPLAATSMVRLSDPQKRLLFEQSVHAILGK